MIHIYNDSMHQTLWISQGLFAYSCSIVDFSTVLVSLNYHMMYLQHAAVPWVHIMGEG